MPSVSVAGDIRTVEISARGSGASREVAIRDAVSRAVEEVHGRAVSMVSVSEEWEYDVSPADLEVSGSLGLKVQTENRPGRGDVNLRVTSQRVIEATTGLVTSIRVIEEARSATGWQVVIVATVAEFMPPGGTKPRVVVGAPRSARDVRLEGSVLNAVRSRVEDALIGAGEVVVLDRGGDPDVSHELALASSDRVSSMQALKRGQEEVADFVIQLEVSNFATGRSVRRLRTVDRELVRYDSEVELIFRIVHVATGQFLSSGSATASRASRESTRDTVDIRSWEVELLDEVLTELGDKVTRSFGKEDQSSR